MRHTISILSLVLLLGLSTMAAAENSDSGFHDSRVQEVLTLTGGNLSLEVIMAKVEAIGSFPELSANDLVKLKNAAVPEPVLVRMIELQEWPTAAARESQPPAVADEPAPAPLPGTSTATLRIEAERKFWITFYEVAVNSEVIKSSGKLWSGISEPGQVLRRPARVKEDRIWTALEIDVQPGSHEVAVGYSVTVVEDDADGQDDWGGYAREHYVNRGVRALAEDSPAYEGEWNEAQAVRCEVAAGQTCVIRATFERVKASTFGGIPSYRVKYSTEVW